MMMLLQIVLFVHAISVLLLAAALGLEVWMLYQLRRSTSIGEIFRWTRSAPAVGIFTSVSLLIVELTGAYLTEKLTSWSFAWPKLAFWGVVVVGLLGGISGRRLRAIRRGSSDTLVLSPQLITQLRSPFLKVSLSLRIWLVTGILLLTILKSNLQGSSGVLLISLFLGLVSSTVTFRKPRSMAPQI
jgi:hypothetical protein